MNQYELYYKYMYIRYRLIKFCMHTFPITLVQIKYFKRLNKFFNLKNPRSFNEKNQWMKFYHNTPLMERVADKIQLRDYLKEKGLEKHIIPLIQITNNYTDINFDVLPNQFIIKTNHGSGMNTIILDKKNINHKELKAKYDYYMKVNYSDFNHELVYQNIKPKIIIEPYLGNLIDYKIMCTNHKILYTVTLKRYPDGHFDSSMYDSEWDKPISRFKNLNELDIKIKPKHKEEMSRIAKYIAQDFLQVRVDFYEINDHIYIGECTFYCQSGMIQFIPETVDKDLGGKLNLSKN